MVWERSISSSSSKVKSSAGSKPHASAIALSTIRATNSSSSDRVRRSFSSRSERTAVNEVV